MFVLIIKYLVYGLIVLLVLAVIAVGIGTYSFNKAGESKVRQLFENQPGAEKSVITEEDIKNLPEPVKRYMRYTGVVGKEWITSVRLKQKGLLG